MELVINNKNLRNLQMEHKFPSECFHRENGTTFSLSEILFIPENFQRNEPKRHVTFTPLPKFPGFFGKCTGSPSSIYEQLFICWPSHCYVTLVICIFIRICRGKITIVSVTYENVAILKKIVLPCFSWVFFPSCVVFEVIYSHSVTFRETGLLTLYILPKVGYSDEAVNPIRWRKTAVNSLQQVQSPRNSG